MYIMDGGMEQSVYGVVQSMMSVCSMMRSWGREAKRKGRKPQASASMAGTGHQADASGERGRRALDHSTRPAAFELNSDQHQR